jgi:hypothetical protein
MEFQLPNGQRMSLLSMFAQQGLPSPQNNPEINTNYINFLVNPIKYKNLKAFEMFYSTFLKYGLGNPYDENKLSFRQRLLKFFCNFPYNEKDVDIPEDETTMDAQDAQDTLDYESDPFSETGPEFFTPEENTPKKNTSITEKDYKQALEIINSEWAGFYKKNKAANLILDYKGFK